VGVKTAPAHGYRSLLKTVLDIEAGLRSYRPTDRPAPEPPERALEALEELNRKFGRGDPVGLREIRRTCRLDEFRASGIRRYLRSIGEWPFTDPKGPMPWANRPRRKKGGVR
jgi:hypothetical protein